MYAAVPERIIQRAEQAACLLVPAPPQVVGKFIQAAYASRQLLRYHMAQYSFRDVLKSIENYQAAISKSYEINYYNNWTQIALNALAKYQPDKYPEPKELVMPVALPDDGGPYEDFYLLTSSHIRFFKRMC